MHLNSPTNQDICRRLVNREVYHCVSQLVHHFASRPEAADEYYDEVLDLCTKPDYDSAAYDACADLNFDAAAYMLDQYGAYAAPYEPIEDLISRVRKFAAKDPIEFCELFDIEAYESEAFEHWIVSEFLAEKLREKGEIVGELFGLTIWGRCTTGQAIYIDRVIGEIAHEMGILEGQQYSWAPSTKVDLANVLSKCDAILGQLCECPAKASAIAVQGYVGHARELCRAALNELNEPALAS